MSNFRKFDIFDVTESYMGYSLFSAGKEKIQVAEDWWQYHIGGRVQKWAKYIIVKKIPYGEESSSGLRPISASV